MGYVSSDASESIWGRGVRRHQQALRNLIKTDHVPGLLTNVGAEPTGCCALGPRPDFPRPAGARVYAPVGDSASWLILSFFTQRRWRGRGVVPHLLHGAAAFVRTQAAAAVGACPVAVVHGRATDAWIIPALSVMFGTAGFRAVARRSPGHSCASIWPEQ